jgi:hypothetical protein
MLVALQATVSPRPDCVRNLTRPRRLIEVGLRPSRLDAPAKIAGKSPLIKAEIIVFASIASSRVRIVPAVLAVSEDRRAHHRNYEGGVERLAYLYGRGAAPAYAHGSPRNRQQRAVESCVSPLFTSRRNAGPPEEPDSASSRYPSLIGHALKGSFNQNHAALMRRQ